MKLGVVLLLTLAACGMTPGPGAPPAVTPSASPAPAKAPGEARVGDRTRCPVSGEEFVVTSDSPHEEYGGKTYYFCCPHCAAQFRADPQKFVAQGQTSP